MPLYAAVREINPTESELKDKVDALTAKRNFPATPGDTIQCARNFGAQLINRCNFSPAAEPISRSLPIPTLICRCT
jgi:hypothetical protein